jgi:iron complex outermembrane receptor protein
LYGFYDSTTNSPQYFLDTIYGASVKLEQDLGFATLVDTAAYRHLKESLVIDVDLTSEDFASLVGDASARDFSNELQLISAKGSKVEWTVGLFYFSNNYGYNPYELDGPLLGAGPTGRLRETSSGKTRSYAGYAQGTVEVVPNVHFTLGGRYTHDDIEGNAAVDFLVGDFLAVPGVPAHGSTTDDKTTWKAVLDYKPADTLYYVSASTGYKDGLFNIGTLTSLGEPVKPESLNAYEVGLKSELLERRLRFQLAAFYYKQNNPQVYVVENQSTALINAGGAHVKGFEAEGDATIMSNLLVRGGITYLDAKYTDFPNAPGYEPNPNPPYGLLGPFPIDATGRTLPLAPKISASFGFEYQIPTFEALSIAANYHYVSQYYFAPDLRARSGDYSLVDAQISYRTQDDKAKISLWGSNLLGRKFYEVGSEVSGQQGFEGQPNLPRQYGLRLTYQFR